MQKKKKTAGLIALKENLMMIDCLKKKIEKECYRRKIAIFVFALDYEVRICV